MRLRARTALFGYHHAEDTIATIVQDVVIEADADEVWAAVRDVGAVHERLIPGYVLDTRMDGDVRYLTVPGGAVIRELIVGVDGGLRRLAYSAVEGFRLPLTHHHAAFQVVPEGPGRCRLVWTTDVLPHAMAEQVRLRVERGAQVMKETLERAARRDSTA
ncbi:SRPBCC family protein [Streptomyces rubellomurinus]|uniref:SRPBCC family protein n=1 Tax=Streptomyces rubellomurinus (strain ATCC 31215) TaxID=359131 RepID=UPI000A402D33|nr:SRPBCC family protein [Streptomyces rubellomurinus]